MKTNQNYIIKINNSKRLNEDKKFKTIQVETAGDLINTILLLVELLKVNYEIENEDIFDEIYKKSKL